MSEVPPHLCVFAGSNPGLRLEYATAARALADAVVDAGYGIVYGGSQVGLMGALADRALARGGSVIGVIPEALVRKEVAHDRLTELRVVESMHQRKALMSDLASGFIALPGGLGTLEELFEVLTWAQLGIHRKGCGLLDVAGYWRPLTDFLDTAVAEGFVRPAHRDLLLVDGNAAALVRRVVDFRAPDVGKWMQRDER